MGADPGRAGAESVTWDDLPRVAWTVPIPYMEQLGVQLHRGADGRTEVRLPLRPELTNSWKVAHGGVVMTLLDVSMAQAARSAHANKGTGMATIEMKTSFLRPARGELRARARVLRGSNQMAFCEAELRDGDGQLCAHATGTFKYVDRQRIAASGLPSAEAGSSGELTDG